jgi:hypothetical protein
LCCLKQNGEDTYQSRIEPRLNTSLLAEAGASLEQIIDRLVHSDDQIKKKVYLHETKELKKRLQKFSKLMRSLY